jgi:hypothetical protein
METEYIWGSIVGCPVTNMRTFIQSYSRTEYVPGRTLISVSCNHTQKTGRLPLGPLFPRETRKITKYRVFIRDGKADVSFYSGKWFGSGLEFLRPNLVKITSLRKDVERTSHLLRDTVWSWRFVLLDTQRGLWDRNIMKCLARGIEVSHQRVRWN